MSVVLLVDDDPITAETMTELLEGEGHRVIQAHGGQEALAALRGIDHPCVVLLDWLMPDMNGDAVLDAMQRDRHLSSIPVIVTSALGNMEQAVRGRAREFLQKPFDVKHLLQAICRYCHVPSCNDVESAWPG